MKTQLNDLFDQIEPEKGNKLDDKIQVDTNSKAHEIYEKYQTYKILMRHTTTKSAINKTIPDDLRSKDILEFTLLIRDEILNPEKKHRYTGEYITKLIEKSQDKKHTLLFPDERHNISSIGRSLREKEIHIYGNAGHNLGEYMISGKIISYDATSLSPGFFMKGGTIILEGSFDPSPGIDMIGGEILVKNFSNSNHKLLSNNYELLPNGYTRITPK